MDLNVKMGAGRRSEGRVRRKRRGLFRGLLGFLMIGGFLQEKERPYFVTSQKMRDVGFR